MITDTHEDVTEQQLGQLEITIEEAKQSIEKAEALHRIAKNPDFKLLISDGYFVKEASRLVLSKAMPDASNPAIQQDYDNSITAIGYLKRYFAQIIGMANMAEKSLRESEQTREDILNEGARH